MYDCQLKANNNNVYSDHRIYYKKDLGFLNIFSGKYPF